MIHIRFRDFPIRRKLLAIVLLAISVAVVTSSSTVILYDRVKMRADLTQELHALAQITAQRSNAGLMFNDVEAVTSNLEALTAKSHLDLLCVYDVDGNIFALVDVLTPLAPRCQQQKNWTPGSLFLEDRLQVIEAIVVQKKVIGHVLLQSDLAALKKRSLQFFLVSLLAAAIAILMAYLATHRLTHQVATPISQLTRLAAHIRATEDYSLRATPAGQDEVGDLVQNFNDMVSKIQQAQIAMKELLLEVRERSDHNEAQAEQMSARHDAIRDFFSGVTHDLRQPLQAIDMFVNVLEHTHDEQTRQDIYRKLSQAVTNLSSLFRELLDVARFESKVEGKSEPEQVNLGAILQRISHEFEVLAADKGLKFRLKTRGCVVLSETTMLERIIRNLVSNAVRYTEKGGILLAVRLRQNEVWIEIWDTGRGIPVNKRESIFQRFAQVEPSDARKGHGLGLSIVQRLANALGHRLELFSREGRGTLFRLCVPRLSASAADVQTQLHALDASLSTAQLAASVSAQMDALGTHLKILLVDDDALVLDAVTQLLHGWGMSVRACSSFTEALSWATTQPSPPSLIVSDFNLENDRCGTDLIEALRDLWQQPVPGLIISGTQTTTDLEKIRALGLQMLGKPVKPPRLRALINFLVTRPPPETPRRSL